MRNGKLSRRAMLKASTALAAGAIVTQSLDAFAQPSASLSLTIPPGVLAIADEVID
jgi:hypothetical protein